MDSKKKKKSGIGRLKAKRQSMMTAPSSQTRRASTQFVVSSPAHGSQDEIQLEPVTTQDSPLSELAAQTEVKKAKVIWTFQATGEGEVTVEEGGIIEILEDSSQEWYFIRYNDTEGFFPKSYVELIREPSPEATPESQETTQVDDGGKNSLEKNASTENFAQLPPNADPKDVQRFKIAREILKTEEDYLESLTKLVQIYKAEFSKLSNDPTNDFQEEYVRAIFSNVESLRQISENVCGDIRNRVTNWSEKQTIGEIFSRIAPVFLIYTEYANSYEEGLGIFGRERKRNKLVEQTALECKKRAGGDLEHFLIMPVQRIPRYNLLLNDLLKNTSSDHPDYENLEKGLKGCQGIAAKINEKMRQTAKVKEMSNLVNKNTLFAKLLQANRQLVGQQHSLVVRTPLIKGYEEIERDPKEKEKEKDRDKEKALVIVFSDLFVYATKKALASPDPVKHSMIVPLDLVWFLGSDGTSFEVIIPRYSLSIFPDEKKEQQSRQNFPGLVEKKLIEQLAVYWANTHEVEQKKMVDIQKEAGGKREKKMMSALAAWGAGGGDAADELYSATQEDLTPSYPYRYGKFKFYRGGKYEGWWKSGLPHGHGTFSYHRNVYVGQFVLGVQLGHGKCTYFTGDTLEGAWKGNMANGICTFTTLHGDVYTGGFVDNLKHGTGEMKMVSGNRYKGEWRNDHPNGYGELHFASGLRFSGDFKDGMFDGKGELWAPTGKMYRGHWVSNTRQGTGTMNYGDGTYYTGNWSNNKYHGLGTFHNTADGSFYSGEWVNGIRDGEGLQVYANGDIYCGQFKSNLRHGKGNCNFASEDNYIGTWRNDKFQGKGRLKKKNGVEFNGTFSDGLVDGSTTLTTPKDKYTKSFRPSNLSEPKLTIESVPRIQPFIVEF